MKKTILTLFLIITTNIISQIMPGRIHCPFEGEAANDRSASEVALSRDGTTMAIGAPNNSGSGGIYRGHVRIYRKAACNWNLIGEIDGTNDNELFGGKISLSDNGDHIVIGSSSIFGNNYWPPLFKGIKVFRYTGGSSWVQQGNIQHPSGRTLGGDVAINGDGTVVATFIQGTQNSVPAACIFQYSSGNWTQKGTDLALEYYDNAYYFGWTQSGRGESIDISSSGNRVAIGEQYYGSSMMPLNGLPHGLLRGRIKVVEWDNVITNNWVLIGGNLLGNGTYDKFGYSVSMNSDGSKVIGSSVQDIQSGRAYVKVFEYLGNSNWVQKGSDIHQANQQGYFGISVSISDLGDKIVFAEGLKAYNGVQTGGHLVYSFSNNNWNLLYDISNSTAGYAISSAIDGNGTMIATGTVEYNNHAGKTLLYSLISKADVGFSGNNIPISNNDNTPSLSDNTNYGDVLSNIPFVDKTFAIHNFNILPLTVCRKTITGPQASNFTDLNTFNCSNGIMTLGSAFNIRFVPNTLGLNKATVNYYTNDKDDPVFSFDIQANVVSCQISTVSNDILGVANDHIVGGTTALSKDGNILAVTEQVSVSESRVKTYQLLNGIWTAIGNTINNPNNLDDFGTSLTLNSSGNILAIGATQTYSNQTNKEGYVNVYELVSNNWMLKGSSIIGSHNGSAFGKSVSVNDDGDILAIGAPSDNTNGTDNGACKVYKFISGNWTLMNPVILGTNNFDNFGHAVSLSGDGSTIGVTAPNWVSSGSPIGQIKVYKNISGSWVLLGNPINGLNPSDGSLSIALNYDGNKVVCGFQTAEISGQAYGRTKVYEYINNNWSQIGNDINGTIQGQRFGEKVAINSSGNLVAITAPEGAGTTKIYNRVNNTWEALCSDIIGSGKHPQIGMSISMSKDGNQIAVGSIGHENSSFQNIGIIRTYSIATNSCRFGASIPITSGSYMSSIANKDGNYVCYCDDLGKLLLAIDTSGSRAIINPNSVTLAIGFQPTTTYSSAGGVISNPNGGVVFNRFWNVTPLTQPSIGSVKVKFPFSDFDFTSIQSALTNSGTTIISPDQLEMFKLYNGNFSNLTQNGTNGIILTNGTLPTLNQWAYSTYNNSDHMAEFKVASFSGGGGGAGANNKSLNYKETYIESYSSNSSIMIGPNPFNYELNIFKPNNESEISIKIFNLEGKVFINEKIINIENIINTNELPSGLYVLEIEDNENKKQFIKLIKN